MELICTVPLCDELVFGVGFGEQLCFVHFLELVESPDRFRNRLIRRIATLN